MDEAWVILGFDNRASYYVGVALLFPTLPFKVGWMRHDINLRFDNRAP